MEPTGTNRSNPRLETDFVRLMSRTRRQALNIATRMVGNRDDAEDLLQEAYLKAYRAFSRYDPELPFEKWLYRIMTNTAIDRLRRRPRFTLTSLEAATPGRPGGLEVPDPAPTPEQQLLSPTLSERLEAALNALQPEFRLAVALCDLEGMSYEEIARSMNCSTGTVRSRIHRGRKILRRLLQPAGSPALPSPVSA